MPRYSNTESYQVDDLFLLVGTNPLPDYVAASLLLRPQGRLHLLCSEATRPTAKRLLRLLGRSRKRNTSSVCPCGSS